VVFGLAMGYAAFCLWAEKKGVKDDCYWTLSDVDIMEEMK